MTDADLSTLAKFTTAGLAGIFGWIVVHPFNTLAVRMNLANYTQAVGAGMNFGQFAKTIIAREGR
jgi:solute carrier family 25 oxoglutarate transporter 11